MYGKKLFLTEATIWRSKTDQIDFKEAGDRFDQQSPASFGD